MPNPIETPEELAANAKTIVSMLEHVSAGDEEPVTPAEVYQAAIWSLEANRPEYALRLLREALALEDKLETYESLHRQALGSRVGIITVDTSAKVKEVN